jgi:hypothetical protein
MKPGLTGYHCGAWMLLAFALFFTLRHYDLIPTVPQADLHSAYGYVVQYLYDVSGRIMKDAFCLPEALAFIGSLAYALSLLLAVRRMKAWTREAVASNEPDGRAWRNLLVGLPVSLNRGAIERFVARGAAHTTAPVRDAITLFPAIGFLGTVVGITIALGGLPKVMASRDTDQLISGLLTAFDTTFLGLVAALSLTLVQFSIDRATEQMAALIDEPVEKDEPPPANEPEEEYHSPVERTDARHVADRSEETPRRAGLGRRRVGGS